MPEQRACDLVEGCRVATGYGNGRRGAEPPDQRVRLVGELLHLGGSGEPHLLATASDVAERVVDPRLVAPFEVGGPGRQFGDAAAQLIAYGRRE